jgi:hypothetical protein
MHMRVGFMKFLASRGVSFFYGVSFRYSVSCSFMESFLSPFVWTRLSLGVALLLLTDSFLMLNVGFTSRLPPPGFLVFWYKFIDSFYVEHTYSLRMPYRISKAYLYRQDPDSYAAGFTTSMKHKLVRNKFSASFCWVSAMCC